MAGLKMMDKLVRRTTNLLTKVTRKQDIRKLLRAIECPCSQHQLSASILSLFCVQQGAGAERCTAQDWSKNGSRGYDFVTSLEVTRHTYPRGDCSHLIEGFPFHVVFQLTTKKEENWPLLPLPGRLIFCPALRFEVSSLSPHRSQIQFWCWCVLTLRMQWYCSMLFKLTDEDRETKGLLYRLNKRTH